MTLDDELDSIFERRDRDNMQPTIDALLPYYAAHPDSTALAAFEAITLHAAGQMTSLSQPCSTWW